MMPRQHKLRKLSKLDTALHMGNHDKTLSSSVQYSKHLGGILN